MKRNLKWRFFLTLGVVLIAVVYIIPTVTGQLPNWWGKFFPENKINMGLDLRGGMHLILGVQVDKAIETSVEQTILELGERLEKERIRFVSIEREGLKNINVKLSSAKSVEAFSELIEQEYQTFKVISSETGEQPQFILSMDGREEQRIKTFAVDQGKETIRNRIDQFGVAETTVIKHGENQILVELPGVENTERAINLIGKTALLEFKLVDDEVDIKKALSGHIPADDEILYQRVENKTTGEVSKVPFLLKKKTLMTGELITDARVEIDHEYGEAQVSMSFNKKGTRLFSQITGANEKKRLAIVLDDNVYSAPVIREKISGGRAQITGSFTMDEAHDLAIVLRAGALPAPVEILENRTIGPSLGADSIRKGIISILIGGILVILFMAMYYKLSGLVANIALILNLVLIMGVLAALRASLTLPGIAGIVLTVGMAVDANVLIFERIREELRLGKTVRAAIDGGFSKAFSTIVDANVTTLIAAVVLWVEGTGPIQGFAVTLSIGIVSSMFTALFVSRLIFDFVTSTKRVTKLSI